MFKVLAKVDDIAFCKLTSKDVVRHPLVQKIVKAYDDFIRTRKNKEPVQIATELIQALGCGMPEHLFMALYTVTEHLSYQENMENSL